MAATVEELLGFSGAVFRRSGIKGCQRGEFIVGSTGERRLNKGLTGKKGIETQQRKTKIIMSHLV